MPLCLPNYLSAIGHGRQWIAGRARWKRAFSYGRHGNAIGRWRLPGHPLPVRQALSSIFRPTTTHRLAAAQGTQMMSAPSAPVNSSACFETGPRTCILNLSPSVSLTEDELKRRAIEQAKRATDPIERLRCQCLSKGFPSIKRLARSIPEECAPAEESATASLDRHQLVKALTDAGIAAGSDAEAHADGVFGKLDPTNTGLIPLSALIEAVRPPLNSNRKALLTRAYQGIKEQGSGSATLDDLKASYLYKHHPKFQSGSIGREEAIQLFLHDFDADAHKRDGKVTPEDFFNYYAVVGATIGSDIAFDFIIRQAWEIPEGQ